MNGSLLIGPSSGGKSTYIRSMQDRGIITTDQKIIFAFQLEGSDPPALDLDSIVHINMFHPFGNKADGIDREIKDAPFMRELMRQGLPRRAVMLIISRRQLAKRILLREWIEPDLLNIRHPYPRSDFFELINRVDIVNIYKIWMNFLSEQGVQVELISTSNYEYRHIPSLEEALTIIKSPEPVDYTEDEKRIALSEFTFNYHRVDGFEPWTGANQDRAGTYDAIIPYVVGKKILDIGCGLGYFCFRLEMDGFDNILGTEIKKDRFISACAIGEINGTRCRFEFCDLLQETDNRSFDTILMLNVLHHLQDPIHGLKEAAKRARSTLILEYPNLYDSKFQSTLKNKIEFDPSLPLIGVSLLDNQDQTFVFSDKALSRIFINNNIYFRNSIFMQSPIGPDRRIAVFIK